MVFADGQSLHGADFTLHAVSAFAVTLIDDKDVGNLHDPGFDGLHVIAHARHKDDDRDVCQPHDVHLILAHAYSLNQDDVFATGVKRGGYVVCSAGQAAEESACGHAADVNAGISMVGLHANAVTQNGAAGIRTGGVNSYDADCLVLPAIFAGQLVNQRALACPRSPGDADHPRLATVREERFQQIKGFRRAIFNGADGARQGTHFASADALHPILDCELIARGQTPQLRVKEV